MVGRGRKQKTTTGVDKFIQRKIKVGRRKSASSIKHEIMNELKTAISNQAVRRRAHKFGLHGRIALKKPYFNKANWIQRLNYVKMYQDKGMAFGKHVLWSDESKYHLFGSNGKVMIWRNTKRRT